MIKLTTNHGEILIELNPDQAPLPATTSSVMSAKATSTPLSSTG